MDRFLALIRNKYFLAGIAFTVWMCFFDRNDFATQYSYQHQKSNLEREKAFYEKENESIIETITDIRSDQREVQRIAREKYKMKKENEVVYIVTEVEPKEEN